MFNSEILENSIFNWEDLDGKTLSIKVGKEVTKDGETVIVSGYSKDEKKHYILHAIVKDEQII